MEPRISVIGDTRIYEALAADLNAKKKRVSLARTQEEWERAMEEALVIVVNPALALTGEAEELNPILCLEEYRTRIQEVFRHGLSIPMERPWQPATILQCDTVERHWLMPHWRWKRYHDQETVSSIVPLSKIVEEVRESLKRKLEIEQWARHKGKRFAFAKKKEPYLRYIPVRAIRPKTIDDIQRENKMV